MKAFDIFKDICFSLGPGVVLLVMDPLVFQSTPEAFHHSIIPAISPATHAYLGVAVYQNITNLVTGIKLATSRRPLTA